MSFTLLLNHDAKTPKYKQIVKSVIGSIERGVLKQNDQLPSINELSEEYYLARDTVEKAYKELKALGVIDSVRGKGYYILNEKPTQLRVLLVMNKMSAYKKAIYEAFVSTLGDRATVNLHIHHGNTRVFKDIIKESLGHYHYYVIMPHFYSETDSNALLAILRQIPPQELILLDKDLPDLLETHPSVYQDFTHDLYDALEAGKELLDKYEELVLVFPQDVKYPPEIVTGFRNFCAHHKKASRIVATAKEEYDLAGRAYVVFEDSDLAELVKKSKQKSLVLGSTMGIVSFNDTPLKEVLADGITVVSTDHEQMGTSAAKLILEAKIAKIKNPFGLIPRKSL